MFTHGSIIPLYTFVYYFNVTIPNRSRHYTVGSSWTRRLNCFSVVFLSASFFSAGLLQLLYYSAGEDAATHRLASAASLYFIAIIVSALCALTVMEASRINDLVPEIRMWLKRETLAIAAQLAHLAHVEAQDVGNVGGGDAGVGLGGGVVGSGLGVGLGHGGGGSSTVAVAREGARLTSAFRLIECVEQYIHHEEEQCEPVEVFYKIHASPTAVSVTISSLLTMLLIASERLYSLVQSEGWSYGGDMGQFSQI